MKNIRIIKIYMNTNTVVVTMMLKKMTTLVVWDTKIVRILIFKKIK